MSDEPVEVTLPVPWDQIKVGDEFTMMGRRRRVTEVTPAGQDGPLEGFTITSVDAEIADRLGSLTWYCPTVEDRP